MIIYCYTATVVVVVVVVVIVVIVIILIITTIVVIIVVDLFGILLLECSHCRTLLNLTDYTFGCL